MGDIKAMESIKFLPFVICFLFILHFGCAQRKDETCLTYSFEKEYPHAFKFYKDKIIIGNGHELVGFNRSGEEISRIVLPATFLSGGGFLDFLPLSDTSYLITIYGKLYEVTPKAQELLNPNFGESLKGGSSIALTAFQEIDTVNDVTINGIKIFDLVANRIFNYPTKRDLGTYNFEMIDGDIALCTSDHTFCLLPMDTSKETRIFDISFEDYYSFLGMNQGNFVFLTRDYEKKEDHLHFYDTAMKFVKEGILDVSYNDISSVVKSDDSFYMEAPFGNFYSFDKESNKIFAFRFTQKNGICFFPIDNHLRVIKRL